MVLYGLLPPEITYKKGLLPLPRSQEVLESLVGAGHFLCLDLKSGFWQIKMEEASKQYTAFTVGNLAFLNVTTYPLGYAMHWPGLRD